MSPASHAFREGLIQQVSCINLPTPSHSPSFSNGKHVGAINQMNGAIISRLMFALMVLACAFV